MEIGVNPLRRAWAVWASQEALEDEFLARPRRVLLAILLAFEATLGLSYFVRPMLPTSGERWSSLIQLAQAAAMLIWLWRRPGHYRWNTRFFLLIGMLAMASMATMLESERQSRLPSFLLILVTFPFLATLMDGLRLGLITAIPPLAIIVTLLARGRLGQDQGLPLLLLELFFFLISALMARFFFGVVSRLREEKARLEAELKLRASLSQTLFEELSERSRGLSDTLRARPADWAVRLRERALKQDRADHDEGQKIEPHVRL